MILDKKVLAILPARGGSKGIPRKNLQEVHGRSLIQWSFDEAKKSRYIDRIILSTEDEEIIDHAKAIGLDAPFKRPAEFSRDDSPGMDPIIHALGECPGFDLVVLLQVTSPLRLASDIDAALEKILEDSSHSCLSVTDVETRPELMFEETESGFLQPFLSNFSGLRRQDMKPLYVLNGAVYVGYVTEIKKFRSFVTDRTSKIFMEKNRSIDIDTPEDLEYFRNRSDLSGN